MHSLKATERQVKKVWSLTPKHPVRGLLLGSPRYKHWPAGPAHFSDHRASSGQYILSFTGPYRPTRYMSGHQISNNAGPNDDKSQYVLFAWAPVPHLGSFRAVLLVQRDASVLRVVASRSRACQSNTLTSVFRSRRTRYFNANIRDASGHFSLRSTCHGSE